MSDEELQKYIFGDDFLVFSEFYRSFWLNKDKRIQQSRDIDVPLIETLKNKVIERFNNFTNNFSWDEPVESFEEEYESLSDNGDS